MYIIVLFVIIFIACSFAILLADRLKRKWLATGILCMGMLLAMVVTIGFSCFHQKIPYDKEPEVIYGISEFKISTSQEAAGNGTIIFFTIDGKRIEEEYSELDVVTDGKNQLEIYRCEDKGFLWAGFEKKQKIIVHAVPVAENI